MKIPLLSFIFCFFALSGFAQSKSAERSMRAIYLGVATPTGDFASKSLKNNRAGLAMPGIMAGIDVVDFISRSWFGFGGTANYRQNNIDQEALSNGSGSSSWSKPWRSLQVAPMALLKYGITSRANVYAKITAGVAFNWSSEFTLSGPGFIVTKVPANAASFASSYSGGFRYAFSNVGVGLEYGTLLTTPAFEYTRGSNTQTEKQPMNSINFSVNMFYSIR